MKTSFMCIISTCALLLGVVGSHPSEASTQRTSTHSDETAIAGQMVKVDHPLSGWRLQEGSNVEAFKPLKNGGFQFVAPIVSYLTTSVFTRPATGETKSFEIFPCEQGADFVFKNCFSEPYGPLVSYDASNGSRGSKKAFSGNGHVQWQQKLLPTNNTVIEASWARAIRSNQSTPNGLLSFKIDGQKVNWSEYESGALSFRVRVLENTNQNVQLNFRYDCGPGCRDYKLTLNPSRLGKRWKTITLPMYKIVNSENFDFSQIKGGVFYLSGNNLPHKTTVQIDDIRFTKNLRMLTNPVAVKDPSQCPGAGHVTFELSRTQGGITQRLYNQLNRNMTTAVNIYNCYTHLSRHVKAQYNPIVPTADARTGGTRIRFGGSRSARVALHELGHIFGAGTYNWRTWLNRGKFYGPRTTALLRILRQNPNARLNGDRIHFWPYGLNHDREDSLHNRVRHALVVEAIMLDQRIPGPFSGR